MITTILFDFYGVFISDSYGLWLQNNNLKREGIFIELINRRDYNQISEPEFLSELSQLMERRVTSEEIHLQNLQPNNSLVELVQELKVNYKIGLLSNASTRLRVKIHDMNLTGLFDEIFISSEISYTKPDPEAFLFAIKKMDAKPREVLFIDDNPINTTAASNLAITSIQFSSVEALKKELGVLQVL